jgi:hypothetical protein
MAVKPAEPSTARAAPAVAAAAAAEAAGRGEAAEAAEAAIYRSVYSCGPLYSTNAHQHAYLLGPKSHAEAAQPCAGGAQRSNGGRARTW